MAFRGPLRSSSKKFPISREPAHRLERHRHHTPFAKTKGYDMCTFGGKPARVIAGSGYIGKAGKNALVAVAVQTLLLEGGLDVSRKQLTSNYSN